MKLLQNGMNLRSGLIPDRLRIHWTAAFLVLATWQGSVFAQSSSGSNNEAQITGVSARHVMGLEKVRKNARGQMTFENDALKFQKSGGAAVELRIASLLSVFTGQQEKQVGGLPVVLGRAATPYGGGRVIALFSHKKFDTLTLEYRDEDGGVHAAIFQLAQGQAQLIQNALAARGIHINEAQTTTAKPTPEDKSESK